MLNKEFKMRGKEVTRLETFMDAAFAFATTMLVISVGTLPKNYHELILSLKEIPAFLSSFCIIMIFWLSHRSWSRKYGLEDRRTITLSLGLIFVLLIYIYPLRLIFSRLFAWLSGGWLKSTFEIQSMAELIGLFVIYGLGLFALSGLMSLLYQRAYSKRASLELSAFETEDTKLRVISLAIVSLTGLIAAILALLLPIQLSIWSTFIYTTIPVSMGIAKRLSKRATLA